MKIGVSVDETKGTRYTIGKLDFYTRLMDMDPELATKLTKIEELSLASQRILGSLYNSGGKFVMPEDLEKLECVNVEGLVPAMPVPAYAKPHKKLGSVQRSSSVLRPYLDKKE